MKAAVVMPCHAYPQHREEAIRSICQQVAQPDLVVCVFNGISYPEYLIQQERALDVFRMHGTKFPVRMEYIDEGNVSAARNHGFEMAIGYDCDWVIPLDEDDLLHREYIWRMERAQKALRWCGVLYPDWVRFGGWRGYVRVTEYAYAYLLDGPFIISTSCIATWTWDRVRRCNGMGYDENLCRHGLRWEDYLFYLQAGGLGVEMARVGLGLVRVRGRGQGSQIANATQQTWWQYAQHQLSRLGIELAWQPPEPS